MRKGRGVLTRRCDGARRHQRTVPKRPPVTARILSAISAFKAGNRQDRHGLAAVRRRDRHGVSLPGVASPHKSNSRPSWPGSSPCRVCTAAAAEHRGGHAIIARSAGGTTHRIYKLPIATFANPPAIDSRTGNVHGQTVASGELVLRPRLGPRRHVAGGNRHRFWEGVTRLLASSAPVEPMRVSSQRQMISLGEFIRILRQ
jgi:hypothetical protein